MRDIEFEIAVINEKGMLRYRGIELQTCFFFVCNGKKLRSYAKLSERPSLVDVPAYQFSKQLVVVCFSQTGGGGYINNLYGVFSQHTYTYRAQSSLAEFAPGDSRISCAYIYRCCPSSVFRLSLVLYWVVCNNNQCVARYLQRKNLVFHFFCCFRTNICIYLFFSFADSRWRVLGRIANVGYFRRQCKRRKAQNP